MHKIWLMIKKRIFGLPMKIVEIFALLPTELSSYKIYKVSMLFCIQRALIYSKFQHQTPRKSFLNLH